MDIEINSRFAGNNIHEGIDEPLRENVKNAFNSLVNHTGKGSDFHGWMDLPQRMLHDQTMISEIDGIIESWKDLGITHVVVIGIGGSYLGTKALFDILCKEQGGCGMQLLFAGHHIGAQYHKNLLNQLREISFGVVVISKSGTTLEPALAFRLIRNLATEMYGKFGAAKRIVAVTDAAKGALRKLADRSGWKSFVIEDSVGGRYSVLSPVGLVPLAMAGVDYKSLLQGALKAQNHLFSNATFEKNQALQYAVLRYLLYKNGRAIEMLVSFTPEFQYLIEWWKQLFGESDGKDAKGVFPAGALFSTDLHSMGQYIQEGPRSMFETFLTVKNDENVVAVPSDNEDDDGLNFLTGRSMSEINSLAAKATMLAHFEGNVPVLDIQIPDVSPHSLGQLMYFFEFSCAIGGYLLDVNPFDQPGVEAYKKNMFALLGKPGMESETNSILAKLK